ncbi:MAG: hypothetical protein LBU34_06530 [Planctomycetaceae bacterium]|nr:hypothetical protein [Planctomycetaceae bacterium]
MSQAKFFLKRLSSRGRQSLAEGLSPNGCVSGRGEIFFAPTTYPKVGYCRHNRYGEGLSPNDCLPLD